MNDDIKEVLERHTKLLEDNNQILHNMRSSMRWASFFRFIYWTILIGSAGVAYYFLQPFIEQIRAVYPVIFDAFDSLKNTSNTTSLF